MPRLAVCVALMPVLVLAGFALAFRVGFVTGENRGIAWARAVYL